MIPTIGVDNRHKMAIAPDSLSIKATNKLLPPTRPLQASPAHKEVHVHGNVEASSTKHDDCWLQIYGRSIIIIWMVHFIKINLSPLSFLSCDIESYMHGNEAKY